MCFDTKKQPLQGQVRALIKVSPLQVSPRKIVASFFNYVAFVSGLARLA